MSSESFRKFTQKLEQDENLKNELRKAGGEAGMPVEAIVAFAAQRGYDFKVEDVSSELSDQQLESVAGGGDPNAALFHKDSMDYKMELDQFGKIDRVYLSPGGILMNKA